MSSKSLLESEYSGMALLLELKDAVDMAIQGHVSRPQAHVAGDVSNDLFISNSPVKVSQGSDDKSTEVGSASADMGTQDLELLELVMRN